MKLAEAMAALEKHGTAQNRKVCARHGAREPLFGVSYANLKALKKDVKTDHALALQLWQTGNHDARVFAAMIADPAAATAALAERIGEIAVDHGETGCKTPDAFATIDKAWSRRRRRSAARTSGGSRSTPRKRTGAGSRSR